MGCKTKGGDFPGGPVVKDSPCNEEGMDLIPGQGAKIPHILRPKHQNIKEKQYCNKFNKDSKNVVHVEKIKRLKVSGHISLSLVQEKNLGIDIFKSSLVDTGCL